MEKTRKNVLGADNALTLYAAAALLAGGIFLLDLLTPLGLAAWLLYFIPMFVASRAKESLAPLAVAAAATAFIAAGYVLTPHLMAPELLPAAATRALAVGALWVAAIVLVHRCRTEAALKRTNEALRAEIRQRLEAEEEARAEFAFREAIANSLIAGLVAVNLEETILSVNDAFCAMTGWSRKELLGARPPYLFWPPEKSEFYRVGFAKALAADHEPGVMEVECLRRSGERFNVLMYASPLKDAQGIVQGYVASFADISDRKHTEAALLESEERFRTLVTHALVGFFIVQDRKIVFLNPEQEKLFGMVSEGLSLERLAESVHPEDLPRFATLLMAMHGGEEQSHETEFRFAPHGPGGAGRDPGGGAPDERTRRWVHCRMIPVTYRGKDAVLVNMVDITRVKEMERIALAQEKMATLGHVAMGVAHEIRNPLSGLNLSVSSLKKALEESEALEPEIRETTKTVLETAAAASQKIEGVLRRVMDFASPATPKRAAISVNHCVEEALHLSQVALRKADIRLSKVLAEDLPRVSGDLHLLEHVLLNLLTNAAQAMEGRPGEKAIAVTSGLENGYAVIRVADSGPGVPEEIRERIFEPYYTTRREGTGIGLSLSRKIISDHGGFLRVDTSRWGGALFTIGLPVDSPSMASGF